MNDKQPPTRAAIYARCSTGRQDVGLQLDELRRIASQRGWVVTNEYVDEATSGSTATRPKLDKLMADARKGLFDICAVQRLDRFGRSLPHLISTLEEFDALHVSFFSAHELLDTVTPQGRLLFTLIGALAQFERSLIVERVRGGIARAKRQGKRLGRPQRDDLDLARVRRLQASGTPTAEIARMLEVPRSTIRSALARAGEKPFPKSDLKCSISS
jgi:DNA invertase Pin-like site-specific DNA recombinase